MEELIALIAEEESYNASQETIEENEVIIDSSVSSDSSINCSTLKPCLASVLMYEESFQ